MKLEVGQRVLTYCPARGQLKVRAVVTEVTEEKVWLLWPTNLMLVLRRNPDGSFGDAAGRMICLDVDDPSQPDIAWVGPQS